MKLKKLSEDVWDTPRNIAGYDFYPEPNLYKPGTIAVWRLRKEFNIDDYVEHHDKFHADDDFSNATHKAAEVAEHYAEQVVHDIKRAGVTIQSDYNGNTYRVLPQDEEGFSDNPTHYLVMVDIQPNGIGESSEPQDPKKPELEFHTDDKFGPDEAERRVRKAAKAAKIKAAWDEFKKMTGDDE